MFVTLVSKINLLLIDKFDLPEKDGKQEGKSWHQIADGRGESRRTETDTCVTHDLR